MGVLWIILARAAVSISFGREDNERSESRLSCYTTVNGKSQRPFETEID